MKIFIFLVMQLERKKALNISLNSLTTSCSIFHFFIKLLKWKGKFEIHKIKMSFFLPFYNPCRELEIIRALNSSLILTLSIIVIKKKIKKFRITKMKMSIFCYFILSYKFKMEVERIRGLNISLNSFTNFCSVFHCFYWIPKIKRNVWNPQNRIILF